MMNESTKWPDKGMMTALELLKPISSNEPVLLDIGAHRGESLKIFADNWLGRFKYIGLEPNPEAFKDLELIAKSVQSEGRSISCYPMAAGAKDGSVRYLLTKESAVAGVLEPIVELNERVPSGDHNITKEFEVQALSIPSLLARQALKKIDILKVDTEGYDLEVLKGSLDLLTTHSIEVVLTEVFFVPYRINQAFFWDIAAFMHHMGYHFVNLYDTRNTTQGRLYTGNGLWASPQVAQANGFL
jgi:FkbM family methyltransferase